GDLWKLNRLWVGSCCTERSCLRRNLLMVIGYTADVTTIVHVVVNAPRSVLQDAVRPALVRPPIPPIRVDDVPRGGASFLLDDLHLDSRRPNKNGSPQTAFDWPSCGGRILLHVGVLESRLRWSWLARSLASAAPIFGAIT